MLTAQNAWLGASHHHAGVDRRAYLADGHDVDHEAPSSKLHLGLVRELRSSARRQPGNCSSANSSTSSYVDGLAIALQQTRDLADEPAVLKQPGPNLCDLE